MATIRLCRTHTKKFCLSDVNYSSTNPETISGIEFAKKAIKHKLWANQLFIVLFENSSSNILQWSAVGLLEGTLLKIFMSFEGRLFSYNLNWRLVVSYIDTLLDGTIAILENIFVAVLNK